MPSELPDRGKKPEVSLSKPIEDIAIHIQQSDLQLVPGREGRDGAVKGGFAARPDP